MQGQSGTTLIETLIALLILSVVAISVLGMFSQGMQLNASGADYTALTNVAKDELEALLSMPYSDPTNPGNTAYDLAPGAHEKTRGDLLLRVNWRVTEHQITAADADPVQAFGNDPVTTSTVGLNNGNIKLITVTVATESAAFFGRRDVTVQGLKIRE